MSYKDYTISLTEGEYLALQSAMVDQQRWIENAIKERARIASIKIQNEYTNFKINRGESITAIGSTEIIKAAYAENVVQNLT